MSTPIIVTKNTAQAEVGSVATFHVDQVMAQSEIETVPLFKTIGTTAQVELGLSEFKTTGTIAQVELGLSEFKTIVTIAQIELGLSEFKTIGTIAQVELGLSEFKTIGTMAQIELGSVFNCSQTMAQIEVGSFFVNSQMVGQIEVGSTFGVSRTNAQVEITQLPSIKSSGTIAQIELGSVFNFSRTVGQIEVNSSPYIKTTGSVAQIELGLSAFKTIGTVAQIELGLSAFAIGRTVMQVEVGSAIYTHRMIAQVEWEEYNYSTQLTQSLGGYVFTRNNNVHGDMAGRILTINNNRYHNSSGGCINLITGDTPLPSIILIPTLSNGELWSSNYNNGIFPNRWMVSWTGANSITLHIKRLVDTIYTEKIMILNNSGDIFSVPDWATPSSNGVPQPIDDICYVSFTPDIIGGSLTGFSVLLNSPL